MFCPNCGINLNETNLNYCPNCGNKISNIIESPSTSYTTVPIQPIKDKIGSPGSFSRKCLRFALASVIMGIITAVSGLAIITILRIIGSIILLVIHIVGLNIGFSAKKYSKKAAELEPSNSVEKTGSVFAVFGIVINAILLVLAIIFILIFFIIFLLTN